MDDSEGPLLQRFQFLGLSKSWTMVFSFFLSLPFCCFLFFSFFFFRFSFLPLPVKVSFLNRATGWGVLQAPQLGLDRAATEINFGEL